MNIKTIKGVFFFSKSRRFWPPLYPSTPEIEPLINAEIIHSGDSGRGRTLHTNLSVNEYQGVVEGWRFALQLKCNYFGIPDNISVGVQTIQDK